MGVRIIEDKDHGESVLYCSTSMVAFGPVFNDRETCEEFLEWFPENAPEPKGAGKFVYERDSRRRKDPRLYPDQEIMSLYGKFLAEKDERGKL